MKEKIKTIYYCDHCNRKYFYKKIMAFHELYCHLNPANKHICLKDCRNLRITDFVSSFSERTERKEFYCKHFEQQMYSYKKEAANVKGQGRTDIIPEPQMEAKHGTRMPLKCEFYIIGNIEEKIAVLPEMDSDTWDDLAGEMQLHQR